jgi:hypothetical protein
MVGAIESKMLIIPLYKNQFLIKNPKYLGFLRVFI